MGWKLQRQNKTTESVTHINWWGSLVSAESAKSNWASFDPIEVSHSQPNSIQILQRKKKSNGSVSHLYFISCSSRFWNFNNWVIFLFGNISLEFPFLPEYVGFAGLLQLQGRFWWPEAIWFWRDRMLGLCSVQTLAFTPLLNLFTMISSPIAGPGSVNFSIFAVNLFSLFCSLVYTI